MVVVKRAQTRVSWHHGAAVDTCKCSRQHGWVHDGREDVDNAASKHGALVAKHHLHLFKQHASEHRRQQQCRGDATVEQLGGALSPRGRANCKNGASQRVKGEGIRKDDLACGGQSVTKGMLFTLCFVCWCLTTNASDSLAMRAGRSSSSKLFKMSPADARGTCSQSLGVEDVRVVVGHLPSVSPPNIM